MLNIHPAPSPQGVEWDEQYQVVVLPSLQTLDISSPDLPMGVNLAVAGIRTAVSATRLL